MSLASQERRVDWGVLTGWDASQPRAVPTPLLSSTLASAVGQLEEAPSFEAADVVIRKAVEHAREVIAVDRAGIFVFDEVGQTMHGTWGTKASGETSDEHHLVYELGETDRELFAQAAHGIPWMVFEDCPLVDHTEEGTRVVGRGWLACMAIVGPKGPMGTLFTDGARTGAKFDEGKQARLVTLGACLSRALDCYRSLKEARAPEPRHPGVRRAIRLLDADPSLDISALAEELRVSAGRLARVFKQEMGVSVVDFRNERRLARFLSQVEPKGSNLLESALSAGFGSYAQFHRVFREHFGETPRNYLAKRNADRK